MTEQELKENGMFYSDRCQFCHQFGPKTEPFLCPDCIELIKKLGYVKLADAQKLPPEPKSYYGYQDVSHTYKAAQQHLLKAGWRKVELEGKPTSPHSE